jgi:predicted N-acetyltransferase YhbS/uncharacterized protein (DUF1330 family)
MTLVVILTVKQNALEAFRAFERHAATVMAAHGGRIERTVVVSPADTPEFVKEIHVVTFPDEPAFRDYRSDARLARVAHLREASVVHTDVLVGEDGPRYEAVRIREARPADRDAIRDLTLAAYTEYAPQMPRHWEGYRRNIVATLADPAPAEQIVAEQDGVVVGAVLLYPTGIALPGADPEPTWPEVRLLAVAPAARGRGVGDALMRECIRRARARGAPVLALHTTAMMRAAIRMYGRLGFVRAPDLDIQIAPGLTIAGYRLALD